MIDSKDAGALYFSSSICEVRYDIGGKPQHETKGPIKVAPVEEKKAESPKCRHVFNVVPFLLANEYARLQLKLPEPS